MNLEREARVAVVGQDAHVGVESERGRYERDVLGRGAARQVSRTVPAVEQLFRRLESRGASFAIKLRDSNTNPEQQYFVVLDNEKNWLQFVGKK